jgi:UDP-N-acetylglucosamine acyltransferase
LIDIHPTAVVSPKAELADGVTVEPYSIIGPNVTIGSGTVVGPHVVIDGWTTIGANNRIFPFVSIGAPPQDLSYKGEETRVVIGDGNILRENVSIHRGTARGKGVTRVGDHCFLMAYSHVAHDCVVGSHVIMANAATLGGHCEVGDHVSLGGMVAIHQFVRIGPYAFLGGMSGLRLDMPPYMIGSGAPAKLYGPNLVGLRRSGFSRDTIQALKRSYKILCRTDLPLKEAIDKVREEVELLPEVELLVTFMIEGSKRGVTR